MDLDFSSPQFWIAVGQIIMIDILLGGDNAVVIALACRRLDPRRRRLGISGEPRARSSCGSS
jgi:predicted tellurium resistance membrane protein TerC